MDETTCWVRGARRTDRLENPRNLPYDIDSSHFLSFLLKLFFFFRARDLVSRVLIVFVEYCALPMLVASSD
jgi:hypothetical protein